jgi:hypothetical protein
MKARRNALNRGTAVYLGGSRVRFIWPCDCSREEIVKAGKNPLQPETLARLVSYWRRTGITLEQCKRHPDWYHKDSQVGRLNLKHPNTQEQA